MRAKICISAQEIKLFEWNELNMLVSILYNRDRFLKAPATQLRLSGCLGDERKEVLRDHFPTIKRKFSLVHSSSPSLIDINFEKRIAQNRDTSWAGVNLLSLPVKQSSNNYKLKGADFFSSFSVYFPRPSCYKQTPETAGMYPGLLECCRRLIFLEMNISKFI